MIRNLFLSSTHNVFEYITLIILAIQTGLYLIYRNRYLFLGLFIFWRLLYNVGLGFLLHMQSHHQTITRYLSKWGLDGTMKNSRFIRHRSLAWLKEQLSLKMGNDYEFEEMPMEFNGWLLFRHLVDVILSSDFLSYTLFCMLSFRWPDPIVWQDVFIYSLGLTFLALSYWVKTQAHHALTDYAWCKYGSLYVITP